MNMDEHAEADNNQNKANEEIDSKTTENEKNSENDAESLKNTPSGNDEEKGDKSEVLENNSDAVKNTDEDDKEDKSDVNSQGDRSGNEYDNEAFKERNSESEREDDVQEEYEEPERPADYDQIWAELKASTNKAAEEKIKQDEENHKMRTWLRDHNLNDSVWQVVVLLLYCSVSIASIAIGAVYLDDCPKQPMIPKSLLVYGCLFTCASIFSTVITWLNRRREDADKPKLDILRVIEGILNVIAVIWFFICVGYTYHNHKKYQSSDPEKDDYCNRTCYLFSFWMCTSTFILLALGVVVCCGICCCAGGILAFSAMAKAKKEKE